MSKKKKGKGKRMMLHLDPSGDATDEKKDRVYLMVDKEFLKTFGHDLLAGIMNCDSDPNTNGFTAILPGQLMDMPDGMEDHINNKVQGERASN